MVIILKAQPIPETGLKKGLSANPQDRLKYELYAGYVGKAVTLATPTFKQSITLGLSGPCFRV